MSLSLSIDLESATFADLAALVEAARTAGVDSGTRVSLDEDSTRLVLNASADTRHTQPTRPADPLKNYPQRPAPGSGTDAALKFIAHLLGEDRRPNQ